MEIEITVPIFLWSHSGRLFEYLNKIFRVMIAYAFCNFIYLQFSAF